MARAKRRTQRTQNKDKEDKDYDQEPSNVSGSPVETNAQEEEEGDVADVEDNKYTEEEPAAKERDGNEEKRGGKDKLKDQGKFAAKVNGKNHEEIALNGAKPKSRSRKRNYRNRDNDEATETAPSRLSKRTRLQQSPALEPEYFQEKRNLEELWKSAFPVGTEWDQLERVYGLPWKFESLEKAFEEGGVLFGKKVYVFGCTEPQLVPFEGKMQVVHIPVIVVIHSPFPPSDKIGIKSVQMEGEVIVPMKQMKMDWVPYVPHNIRNHPVETYKTQIYTLKCTQRRVALKQLKHEKIKMYEYCLPYIYQPLQEDELEQNAVVQIMYPMEPPVVCDFDWELDEYEELANDQIQKETLAKEHKEDFKKFVMDRVKEEKQKQKAAKEARRKAVEEMSAETKSAFQSMRFYKFYPDSSPDVPDISKVKALFINRYYGKAHEIF